MRSLKEALVHKHIDHYRDFTKDDLQIGDIAVTRNGAFMIVSQDGFETYPGGYIRLEVWDDDLIIVDKPRTRKESGGDVMKIYRPHIKVDWSKNLKELTEKMKPIWERK